MKVLSCSCIPETIILFILNTGNVSQERKNMSGHIKSTCSTKQPKIGVFIVFEHNKNNLAGSCLTVRNDLGASTRNGTLRLQAY